MSNIIITTDVHVLKTGLGYINNAKEVRYNSTIDTCVIDEALIVNAGKTLNDFFLTAYKTDVVNFLETNNKSGSKEQKLDH
ncbi:hypothetical protein AB6D40_023890 [Vibrio cyclitrophicus]